MDIKIMGTSIHNKCEISNYSMMQILYRLILSTFIWVLIWRSLRIKEIFRMTIYTIHMFRMTLFKLFTSNISNDFILTILSFQLLFSFRNFSNFFHFYNSNLLISRVPNNTVLVSYLTKDTFRIYKGHHGFKQESESLVD